MSGPFKEEQVEARADPGGEGGGIRRISASPLRHRAPRCAYNPHSGRGLVLPVCPGGGRAPWSLASTDMPLAVREKEVKEKLESTNRRLAEAEVKVP